MYLQLPLRQWGAGNVYLLVLFSRKVNIAKNPIAIMGLWIRLGIVLKKESNWLVGRISVQHKLFDSDGNHLFFRSGAISLVAAARGSVPQRLKRNLHPLFNLSI